MRGPRTLAVDPYAAHRTEDCPKLTMEVGKPSRESTADPAEMAICGGGLPHTSREYQGVCILHMVQGCAAHVEVYVVG